MYCVLFQMNCTYILTDFLKRIFPIVSSIILLSCFNYGQIVGPGIGAGTVDAKEVIRLASEALRNTQNVKYKAIYQGTGAFSTHAPTVIGEILIEKLSSENQLKAKFAASGQFYQTGSDEMQKFNTTFDGTTINRLRPKEKVVIKKKLDLNNPTERKLGFVTSFFGGGPYHLLLFDWIEAKPLMIQAQSTIIDYEGRATVGNSLCHVVYLEYTRNEKLFRERWYFGVNDYLPRKYEQLATDDKGRHGAFVLTLSNLQINSKLSETAFTLAVPKGYKVEPYKPPTQTALLPNDSLAPDWNLFDSANQEHTLLQYRGKIVVMDFWATWCGPCVQAMPELQKIHEQFKSRGVEVFGINVWEESNAADYMKEHGFTYTLLLKGETTAKAYSVETLPTFYIIDTNGKIIYHATGLPKDITAILEKYLK